MEKTEYREDREIVTITADTADAFSNLIEPQLLYPLDRPGHYGIGVVVKQEKQDVAAGILVFDVESGYIGLEPEPAVLLRWIYVAEEYRGQGIGNQLMEEFYWILNVAGMSGVLGDVPFSEKYNQLCAFLEDWGFTFELRDDYQLLETLGDIGNSPVFFGKMPGKTAWPLRDLPGERWKHLVSDLRKKEERETLPEKQEDYDLDVSCVVGTGDKIRGAFLFQKDAGGRLVPCVLDGMSACSRQEIYDMLLYAFHAAKKKYGDDMEIYLNCQSGEIANLIAYILPDASPVLVRHGVYTGAEEE